MVYLVYLLALIFIVLGFLFGVSVGWKCVHGRNSVGNLMIAPGDENEPGERMVQRGRRTHSAVADIQGWVKNFDAEYI